MVACIVHWKSPYGIVEYEGMLAWVHVLVKIKKSNEFFGLCEPPKPLLIQVKVHCLVKEGIYFLGVRLILIS